MTLLPPLPFDFLSQLGGLPYLAIVLIGAYALLCVHRKTILEVKLVASQARSEALRESDTQVSSFRDANDELRAQVIALLQLKNEAEGRMRGLEQAREKELDDLRVGYEQTISGLTAEIWSLKMDLKRTRAECKAMTVEDERRLNEIVQLQDKLCECLGRLRERAWPRVNAAKDFPGDSIPMPLCVKCQERYGDNARRYYSAMPFTNMP